MNRKLAVTILFVFFGLATWDALLDHENASRVARAAEGVSAFEDGTGIWPVK